MLIGNLEGQLTMQGNYQKYNILGESYDLLTIGDWKRVVVVSDLNNYHLNADYVKNVKLSDEAINSLMTNDYEYNIWCTVDYWQPPFNPWQPWPNNLYIHNSIERFDSTTLAKNIPNSNLISTHLDRDPIRADNQGDGSIGFGFAGGDIFYGYGNLDKSGFVQDFSGAGRGSVYVR